MKDWPVVRGITVAFAVIALAGAGGQAAVAQTPIGPHQHFSGMVNGVEGSVVVDTVCPGPAGGHRIGPVKRGQTMAVAEVMHGHGYTGLFSHIHAWFGPVRTGHRPVMLTFTKYGLPRDIPRSVRVPCNGTGEAVFSSCPYLAPCAAGFVQDRLQVRFENIAAQPSRCRAGRQPRERAGRAGRRLW
jgi:hypothetical protein